MIYCDLVCSSLKHRLGVKINYQTVGIKYRECYSRVDHITLSYVVFSGLLYVQFIRPCLKEVWQVKNIIS